MERFLPFIQLKCGFFIIQGTMNDGYEYIEEGPTERIDLTYRLAKFNKKKAGWVDFSSKQEKFPAYSPLCHFQSLARVATPKY